MCTRSAGVKEWDATNSTFPDGLAAFAEKSGWKFQMHNRMWSDDNIYATQNGGKYKFIVEPQVGERIPDSDFRNLNLQGPILTLAVRIIFKALTQGFGAFSVLFKALPERFG